MEVLMLGWEFPPLFSGGLGVATYGMVKALRSSASIRLIVPRTNPSSRLGNVRIVGVDRALKEELIREGRTYDLSALVGELQRIPLELSSYHSIRAILEEEEHESAAEQTGTMTAWTDLGRYFEGHESYGPDIQRKVYLFSRLADLLSRKLDFRIIHAHDWVTYPAGLRIRARTGKPLVLHVHALETDRAGSEVRNEVYELERRALNRADAIIAVSEYTRDQLGRHYGIPKHRVAVVHNGIDPRSTGRRTHAFRDKLVVFLGRVTRQKGPEFLLETAEKVLRVYPRVKFVVAGTGDAFVPLLETAAWKKLGSKFLFTGFLDRRKVDDLLSMADVYFMPSVSEPFGLTALEAAQFGVPGVLSRQSGAHEVLPALTADFWDTDKYANYIHALLRYNALHDDLARRSREIASRLTWDEAAAKVAQVYRSLVPN
jgi:glycosyltransferase involved in cell wall biosynthesis